MAELRLERADDAFAHANRGLDVARMTGQGVTVTTWLAIASLALVMKGRVSDAARLAHGSIDAARLIADDWRTVWALEADALAAFWAGDTDRALDSSREMVARSERVHTFLSGPAQIQLAGAEYAAGDAVSAGARLSALDAEPTWRLLDRHAAHGWELLTRAQLALGETDRAKDTAARALRRAETSGLPQQLATARCARAAVLLANGEPDAANARRGGGCLFRRRRQPVAERALRGARGHRPRRRGQRERGIAELERAEHALWACGAVREADAAARELRRLGRRVLRRSRPLGEHPGLASSVPASTKSQPRLRREKPIVRWPQCCSSARRPSGTTWRGSSTNSACTPVPRSPPSLRVRPVGEPSPCHTAAAAADRQPTATRASLSPLGRLAQRRLSHETAVLRSVTP